MLSDVSRCFKMNAIKLNCTLKSVTKVCAQVVLFLAVLAWCSSALKRHTRHEGLPETGFWIVVFIETQSVLRSGLSTWSPQQLLWWIGGWGSRGWSWHLSSRPMLWCHGRAWPATCYEALARTAESKVEEAERQAERMMQTIVRPPIRHLGPEGSARNAMEREPTEDDVDIEEPEEHLIWGRWGEMSILHDATLIVGEQLQWTSLQLRLPSGELT